MCNTKDKCELQRFKEWAIGEGEVSYPEIPEKWNERHNEFKLDKSGRIDIDFARMKELYLKLNPHIKPESNMCSYE